MIDWERVITIFLALIFGNIIGWYFGYKRCLKDQRKHLGSDIK